MVTAESFFSLAELNPGLPLKFGNEFFHIETDPGHVKVNGKIISTVTTPRYFATRMDGRKHRYVIEEFGDSKEEALAWLSKKAQNFTIRYAKIDADGGLYPLKVEIVPMAEDENDE